SPQELLLVSRAVVAEELLSLLDGRLDVDGAPPDAGEVGQGVPRALRLERKTGVLVTQVELAPILVVPILDEDDRLPEIRELIEELALDLLEVAALDHVLARLAIEGVREELMTLAEVLREELVDERHVVIDRAHLEDLLATETGLRVPFGTRLLAPAFLPLEAELPPIPTLLDVAEELDPKLVRVELPGLTTHRARMLIGVVDDLGGRADLLGHHPRMPIGGPSLVHDLRHRLGREVVRLLANHGEDIALPALERGVL